MQTRAGDPLKFVVAVIAAQVAGGLVTQIGYAPTTGSVVGFTDIDRTISPERSLEYVDDIAAMTWRAWKRGCS